MVPPDGLSPTPAHGQSSIRHCRAPELSTEYQLLDYMEYYQLFVCPACTLYYWRSCNRTSCGLAPTQNLLPAVLAANKVSRIASWAAALYQTDTPKRLREMREITQTKVRWITECLHVAEQETMEEIVRQGLNRKRSSPSPNCTVYIGIDATIT